MIGQGGYNWGMETMLQEAVEELSYDELLALDADWGARDLYHLITKVLGFHRLMPDGQVLQMSEAEHRPMCDFLSSPWPAGLPKSARRLMCSMQPRGTLKTITAMGRAIQVMIQNPDVAILWVCEKKEAAIEASNAIKEVLRRDEFIARYGDWRDPKRPWKDMKWTIGPRTMTRKDPTFAVAGVGVNVQGKHPDIIFCDDLQGLENSHAEGIRKVKQYLRFLIPVLNPGGTLIWLCTRWASDDAAQEILDKAAKGMGWELLPCARGFLGAYAVPGDEEMFRQADGSCHFVPGGLVFPSVLDEQAIEDHRREMNLFEFSCQILNDPIPEEGAFFTEGCLRYVDDWGPDDVRKTDHPSFSLLQGLSYMLIVDPATAEEMAKGDDNVLMVIGWRGTKLSIEITIVEVQGSNLWKPDEIIDRVFLMAERWMPSKVVIESTAMQKWVKHYLMLRMRQDNVRLPLDEFDRARSNRSKKDDLKMMQPFFRSGMVRQFRSMEKGKFDEQLLKVTLTSTSHDDWPDALSMGIRKITERRSTGIRASRAKRKKYRNGSRYVGRW